MILTLKWLKSALNDKEVLPSFPDRSVSEGLRRLYRDYSEDQKATFKEYVAFLIKDLKNIPESDDYVRDLFYIARDTLKGNKEIMADVRDIVQDQNQPKSVRISGCCLLASFRYIDFEFWKTIFVELKHSITFLGLLISNPLEALPYIKLLENSFDSGHATAIHLDWVYSSIDRNEETYFLNSALDYSRFVGNDFQQPIITWVLEKQREKE